MLAIVEDDQCPLVAQPRNEARDRISGGKRDAQHGGQRRRNQIGARYRCQPDEPQPVRTRGACSLCHGRGDRGLPDAARPDDGEQPAPGELLDEGRDDAIPADDPRQRTRDVVAADRGRRSLDSRVIALAAGGSHENVAAAGNIGDETVAALAVAQGLAQRGDVHTERGFVHDGVGPGTRHQLVLANGLTCAFHQGDEDVERAAADAQRLVPSSSVRSVGINLNDPNTYASLGTASLSTVVNGAPTNRGVDCGPGAGAPTVPQPGKRLEAMLHSGNDADRQVVAA